MRWFGKPWSAGCCTPDRHVETPVGQACGWCGEPIGVDDQGITMPLVDSSGAFGRIASHLDCHLRQVVGSVAHLRGTCSCVGGTDEDPPGMTRRQAAAAAAAEFRKAQP